MKIALAQIYPTLGNLTKNYQLIEKQIQTAIQGQKDLIVFPELALTGYFLKDQVVDLAQEAAGFLEKIKLLSQKIDILIGSIEESKENQFYNSAFYYSAGKLSHIHRKIYLPTYGMFDEKRYFSAGSQLRAFETKFGKAAILICEDAWHLSSVYLAALDGAKILYVISSSPLREGVSEYWQDLNRIFASKFNLVTVYCNRVGVEDGVTFWGGSEVYYPDGALLGRGKLIEEDNLNLEIDLAKIREARISTPLLRDERKDLVLKELERIWREES